MEDAMPMTPLSVRQHFGRSLPQLIYGAHDDAATALAVAACTDPPAGHPPPSRLRHARSPMARNCRAASGRGRKPMDV